MYLLLSWLLIVLLAMKWSKDNICFFFNYRNYSGTENELNNYFLIVATLPLVFSAAVNAQNLITVFFYVKVF